MNPSVLLVHELDNVAVAARDLARGEAVEAAGRRIMTREAVPAGHKIALRPLAEGDEVVKYGRRIGRATAAIAAGDWVHSHNMKTALGRKSVYSYRPPRRPGGGPERSVPGFLGYRRRDGRVGTRNEIWILNTVGCVNKTAERLAALANERFRPKNCDGIFAFPHPYGCSQLGEDLENTRRVLSALIRHPNAGGVLLLGLGCENNQLESLTGDAVGLDPDRLRTLACQAVPDELEAGLRLLAELVDATAHDRRVEVPASELVLGMKCGGSDAFSGLTANPLAGRVADRMTAAGGTVILSEVPEMFGAEQALMDRAATREVFEEVVTLIDRFKRYFEAHGQPIYENPSPGNKAGGLTTLEEKSLGAIAKGGAATVTQVLGYGARATERGLVLVEAPGNDAVSSTAVAAAGATLLLFTTGRGTPFGGPVPTLKISSTTGLFRAKPRWIDFDAGRLLDGEHDAEELAGDLARLVVEVASGNARTKSEVFGAREIAIWKTGVTL